MDQGTLIDRLNKIFCNLSKGGKKYSEVWLTRLKFGDLYSPEKYTMHVRANFELRNCNDEIKDIVHTLYNKDKDAYRYIFEVVVYDSSNNFHCQSDDIMIYEESKACE